MKLEEIFGKKIGIFGYGVEGESLVRYLAPKGVKDIAVFDEAEVSEDKKREAEKIGVKLVIGPWDKIPEADISALDIAFRSPGVKRSRLDNILPPKAGVTSLVNLFFANCKGRIIGITGTKGKSTTARLVSSILTAANQKNFIGGNIGNSPLDFLDEVQEKDFVILELSSFQLEDIKFSPQIAVILPIFVDHLDYHENVEDYLRAKSPICKFTSDDSIIISSDQENSLKLIDGAKGRKFIFSTQSEIENGCIMSGGDLFCRGEPGEKKFEGVGELSGRWKVPLVNLQAAFTLAYALGLDVKMDSVKEHFKKPEFRIDLVKEIEGIRFYNDSASTNPISTIAAIETMDDETALILGGSSKNLNYADLARRISESGKIVLVYLFGETAAEIASELEKAGSKKETVVLGSLDEIFEDARKRKGRFKSLLFSPASASFDQFKNYRQRGDYFNSLVEKWQNI
ncbi:MAG: UDP-N-acetylmuramoyl-L-alanine--D-glutamate ligase [Candidatus Berkelbacteria bacterium]|nr:UDP-N-acetylmuramoyl-L-alanine--D-glutamate ligase [Candidatus Berkelbacteria bacterium]